MRRLLLVVLALTVYSGTAMAGEWNGFLMDTMCAVKKTDQASTHTAECMKNCARGGFGLVTKDGKYIKFDEAGNVKALKTLEASAKQDNLEVRVTGELKSGLLQVNSIEML
jgi:hypothetical protein